MLLAMRRDEFEQRAAAMRARSQRQVGEPSKAQQVVRAPALVIPDLPPLPPYTLLGGKWRPSHTKTLLSALGDVHPLVIATVRVIGSQQVGFDGLIPLHVKGALDLAVSVSMLAEGLRQYDRLIHVIEHAGGSVTGGLPTTANLDNEAIPIWLREASERRPKVRAAASYRDYEYSPTGQLWFAVASEYGSKQKTFVSGDSGITAFLKKLQRGARQLPGKRAEEEARRRAFAEANERRQAQWREEQEARRQWQEEQERFKEVDRDIEDWQKAARVRAYAAAYEKRCSEEGVTVHIGSAEDAWLRWLAYYADALDPLTREEGPTIGHHDQTEEGS